MDFRRDARRALAEDHARRDITSRLFVPPRARGRARIVAREAGVLAGLPVAAQVFREMDARLSPHARASDGDRLGPGQAVLDVEGPLRALLSAERSALNFLTHLSGVATLTRRFVDAAGPGGPAILETRKTIPGLRDLQKYAVRMGGGHNHRRDLAEAVLIKENHLAFFHGPAGREDLIHRIRAVRHGGRSVQMECRDRDEALWGLEAGVDILLLDNIPLADLPDFVTALDAVCAERKARRPLLEVSGGVTADVLPALARAGVDRVSVGRLTHSATCLDMSMDLEVL